MADNGQITTLGQFLIREALPSELHGVVQSADKKSIDAALSRLAKEQPDRYREVTRKLLMLSRIGMTELGGFSYSLDHLVLPEELARKREAMKERIDRIIADPSLTKQEKQQRILEIMTESQGRFVAELMQAVEGNPIREQVASGARGNPYQMLGLILGPITYVDSRDRPVPVPIVHSYSEGLRPHEYWASTYGARRGLMGSKFAVADAGALSKHINQTVHRGIVIGLDGDEPDTPRGLPVETNDPDNDGALLAAPVGGFPRNTIITPDVRAELLRQGIERILVRSPVAGLAVDGLYARDVGVREFGRLPVAGENVSMTAAQAIGEPLQQGQLNTRHGGGQLGQILGVVSGFDYIEKLFSVPPTSPLWASLATRDGEVGAVIEAPAGGHYVMVGGVRHFVRPEQRVTVQPGDVVEAGDALSNGVPNPAEVTELKGIGEGRRYFANQLTLALRSLGAKAHRRNAELIARELINNVELTDEFGDGLEGDILPYNLVAARWQPRADALVLRLAEATGKYLEKPYLHYTIGTRVTPRVARELEELGLKEVLVHDRPPPWKPKMVRAVDHLSHDPDWQTRLFGSTLQRSLLRSAHRGATSDPTGTSFVPSLVKAVEFGREGLVRTPAT